MNKKIIAIFTILALLSVLVVACSRDTGSASSAGDNNITSASTPTATESSGSEVHLTDSNFAQTSITITKGSKLTLINDTATFHNIQNGSWINSSIKQLKENGAPNVNIIFKGNDKQSIGPFSVAGTYHLYCSVHTGMNLTVIVQ